MLRGMWLEAKALEIARGHDGLLQGKPEPVVALGLYVVDTAGARLAARGLVRFAPMGTIPATVAPVPSAIVDGGRLPKGAKGWVALAVALEEDRGDDVRRLYAALERPGDLHCVADDGAAEHSLADALARTAPRPVHLLVDGADAASTCASDDWVGAAIAAFPARGADRAPLRLHFSSGDRRNDWTAVVKTGA
jgi:hypothetical protein